MTFLTDKHEAEPPLLLLQGAPSVRVPQRPVQRSVSAAQAHYRAFAPPGNLGTVLKSLRISGGGGGGGGRRPGSKPERKDGEPGPIPQPEGSTEGKPEGEEETGESRGEARSESETNSLTDGREFYTYYTAQCQKSMLKLYIFYFSNINGSINNVFHKLLCFSPFLCPVAAPVSRNKLFLSFIPS